MEFEMVHEDAREYSLAITEIDVEGGPDHLTLWLDQEEAIQLFAAVDEGIGDYVREMRFHKALYERTKHAHEDEMDPGWDPEDPRSPGYHDRLAGIWDDREKS